MTAVDDPPDTSAADALARHRKGIRIGDVLATTDHKMVGYLYLGTSFAMFLIAGLMAMFMRAELMEPGMQVMNNLQYNQLFTIHGTIMLLLFATPLFAGFANVIVPLQIGAPDVAFPRLNTLSYYLFLFGALMVLAGFLMPGGDWAPSVEEAPDVATLRPFTAGIAQAPIAARNSDITGNLMNQIERGEMK